MAAPKWQAGHLYLPGDIVQPVQAAPATNQVIPNPGFESGDSSWTKTNTTIVNEAGSFAGSWHAKMVYAGGATGGVQMASPLTISPGQAVTAACMLNPSGASDQVGGQVRLSWLDASNNLISQSTGNQVDVTNGSGWRKSSVSAVAPANAAKFKVSGEAFNLQAAGVVLFDAFTLTVGSGPSTGGLIYKAVQADPGTSGASEPVWPTVNGVQVIDNEVTWEATTATYVKWEASPVLESGATEPTWPTTVGSVVSDGTIAWECFSRRIEDENCPNTKVVQIIASKVFAVDEDIVRFSATANPLDWTSEQDAGYLPTGLQSGNANYMSVLQQYRSNLVAFSASSFQDWQVDPDPAAMALLDQMEGIGSTWYKAAQPVANDLLFLSNRGVRSIGIAAANESLAAGDVGEPIDVLVRAAMAAPPTVDGIKPLATYYPGAGQYWLAFRDCGIPTITGDLPDGDVGDVVDFQYTVTPAYPGQTVTLSVTGALPTGLSMDTAGHVTGTLTTGGSYSWTITPSSDCGDGAALADSADVALTEFWLVRAPVGTGDSRLWSSTDAASWPVSTTRNPTITAPTYGAFDLGVGAVGIAKQSSSTTPYERITGFDFGVGITPVLTTGPTNINFDYENGGVAFTVSSGDNLIDYTLDKGLTWLTSAVPNTGGGSDVKCIARLDSGRWLTAGRGVAPQYFRYSDEDVPTNWVQGQRSDNLGVGSAGDGIYTNGTVAISFCGTSDLYRTTDGLTWSLVTLPSHGVNGTAQQGIAIGDVFLASMDGNGTSTRIKRSTDAGLTWATVTVAAAFASAPVKFAHANGVIVASCGTRIYRSTDLGATWTQSSLPFTAAFDDILKVAAIRRVP